MPIDKNQEPTMRKSVSFAPSTSDSRFSALTTDPRYRLPSKKRTHLKLDRRLGGILQDDAFSSKASVDRYGRKLPKGQGRRDLERLYRLASDDEQDQREIAEVEAESGEEDHLVEKELKQINKDYDPARDGGFSTSESESEDDTFSEDEDEEIDAALPDGGEQVPMGEVSHRLAVVNLDWDNIRAEDLMCVASSFVPSEGRILSVTVYPSDFGRARMEKEEVEGPPREIFQSIAKEQTRKVSQLIEKKSHDSEEDDGSSSEDENIKSNLLKVDTGAEFDSVALRKYQLDRLRYYYAVITCSSTTVAQALYVNMDGQEYLYSANFFDMRFIPDHVDFENDKARDSCKKVPDGYKPVEFTTDALMHSNVKLTWDADDTKRKEVQKRAFSRKEIDENDMLAYIGSPSSSEDEVEEDEDLSQDEHSDGDVISTTSRATTKQARREALRAALGLDLEPAQSKQSKIEDRHVGDMQITFTPALSSTKKGQSVFENEPMTREETTAEQYVRKERERKARRKEKAKARRDYQDPDAIEETQDQGQKVDAPDARLAADDTERYEDGFDDPFFENPDAAIEASRKARRADKIHKKKILEKGDSMQTSRKKRAELELIMMGDNDDQADANRHFDMKAIEKGEREARKAAKSKRSRKLKAKDDLNSTLPDSFEMDVEDSRFAKLFDDPAFAIDPTDPKYRDTKGMRALLGEKRKRGEQRLEKQAKKLKIPDKTADHMKESISKIKMKTKR